MLLCGRLILLKAGPVQLDPVRQLLLELLQLLLLIWLFVWLHLLLVWLLILLVWLRGMILLYLPLLLPPL